MIRLVILQLASFIFLFALTQSAVASAHSGREKLSPTVDAYLSTGSGDPLKVWVYFRDRGAKGKDGAALEGAHPMVGERSIARRTRRSVRPVTDLHDLPVLEDYVESVRRTGAVLRRESRYLNAISAWASPAEIRAIASLPFVGRIDRVATYSRPLPEAPGGHGGPEPLERGESGKPGGIKTNLYGPSFKQLDMINVIPLHQVGLRAEGVIVAMLDTGFNRRHVSLRHLDVVAEWDFVNDDSVTRNQPGDPAGQDYHGTNTLSAIGGYAPGSLIGPAWGASFALAKTERLDVEIQVEEDDYVRALEWADSLGADVVSSSLGYYDWYSYSDMDGNTAVTTRAADIAASKGIIVVTAAGNAGPLPWPGIIAPGDGDSVITVGAVDSSGIVAPFSSRGPTFDGRIKPDVMGNGVAVYVASAVDTSGYNRLNGTSFSTPLVAGACALILQMHPSWAPTDVLGALRLTASRAAAPDNDYGWGIINAYLAALSGASALVDAVFGFAVENGGVRVSILFPADPDSPLDLLRRRLRPDDPSSWSPFVSVRENFLVAGERYLEFFDQDLPGGVYQYRLEERSNRSVFKNSQVVRVPWQFALRQSAPNPFVRQSSATATIRYTIGGMPAEPGAEPPQISLTKVEISIYDASGARIRTVFRGLRAPGDYAVDWDGRNERGAQVSSGVYYYKLSVGRLSQSRKLVVIGR